MDIGANRALSSAAITCGVSRGDGRLGWSPLPRLRRFWRPLWKSAEVKEVLTFMRELEGRVLVSGDPLLRHGWRLARGNVRDVIFREARCITKELRAGRGNAATMISWSIVSEFEYVLAGDSERSLQTRALAALCSRALEALAAAGVISRQEAARRIAAIGGKRAELPFQALISNLQRRIRYKAPVGQHRHNTVSP